MTPTKQSLLEWVGQKRDIKRWREVVAKAKILRMSDLRAERAQAQKLRFYLNEFISKADERLALPKICSNAFPKPHGTDWSWRPPLWRQALDVPGLSSVQSKTKLGEDLTLFHDCQLSELTLRQMRNTREADLAPYGLRMDVFSFDGSFLSLVLDLPDAAMLDLQRRHLIRLDTIVELEKPLEIFARLNIKHGPNTEQIVRELPLHEDSVMVEFDLAYTKLNEKRVERGWIDLIFENPQMSQVVLRDLTFSRRPRAEF